MQEAPYETRISYPNYVVFTPANDFDGFYLENTKINPSGDTITAGDNKWYVAIFNWTHISGFPDNFTVYKMSNTSITPINITYFN